MQTTSKWTHEAPSFEPFNKIFNAIKSSQEYQWYKLDHDLTLECFDHGYNQGGNGVSITVEYGVFDNIQVNFLWCFKLMERKFYGKRNVDYMLECFDENTGQLTNKKFDHTKESEMITACITAVMTSLELKYFPQAFKIKKLDTIPDLKQDENSKEFIPTEEWVYKPIKPWPNSYYAENRDLKDKNEMLRRKKVYDDYKKKQQQIQEEQQQSERDMAESRKRNFQPFPHATGSYRVDNSHRKPSYYTDNDQFTFKTLTRLMDLIDKIT
jgi:hypothetical protein